MSGVDEQLLIGPFC